MKMKISAVERVRKENKDRLQAARLEDKITACLPEVDNWVHIHPLYGSVGCVNVCNVSWDNLVGLVEKFPPVALVRAQQYSDVSIYTNSYFSSLPKEDKDRYCVEPVSSIYFELELPEILYVKWYAKIRNVGLVRFYCTVEHPRHLMTLLGLLDHPNYQFEPDRRLRARVSDWNEYIKQNERIVAKREDAIHYTNNSIFLYENVTEELKTEEIALAIAKHFQSLHAQWPALQGK